MKKLLIALVFIVLTGCVGTYKPPLGDGLPVINFEGNFSMLLIYKNGNNCSGGVGLPPKYNPRELNSLPLPLTPDVETAFQIRNYAVSISNGLASATCGGLVSFVPRKGYEYRLKFILKENYCQAVVLEKALGNISGEYRLTDFRNRVEKFAMTTEGSACAD